MSLLSKGNLKVHALIFDLPTSVCRVSCPKCYAKKAERQYPLVLPKRNSNLEASIQEDFVDNICKEIKKSRKYNVVRINSSGDFYSQGYIDKWTSIIEKNPNTYFYAYTKTKDYFNFTNIEKLDNFNLIDSITPLGFNYGSVDYCEILRDKHGYYICPTWNDKTIKCMDNCRICLHHKKIAFKVH